MKKRAPRILLNTRGESVFAPGNTQCSKFSRRTLRFATNLRLLGWLRLWAKSRKNQQALNDAERRGDVYQKDGYYHVKTIATAIVKKQGCSMVLHGGQANLTKDELVRR